MDTENTVGILFDIQHLAAYDGPGIRTVVYLKGCPLRCQWCHNPEGLTGREEIFFNRDRCTLCGACAAVCPNGAHKVVGGKHIFSRDLCVSCGQCTVRCLPRALEGTGWRASAAEVFERVLADKPFFGDDGGMTLSGGEPFFQPAFALDLLRLCKEHGIGTCVETSGYCAGETLEKAAALTDWFLFDIKETNEAAHRLFTGVSNKKILENLALLDRLGARIVLRCPIIPDRNMRREHFENIGRLAEKYPSIVRVELEPYHPIGLSKYAALGQSAVYESREFLSPSALCEGAAMIRNQTGKPVLLSTGESI